MAEIYEFKRPVSSNLLNRSEAAAYLGLAPHTLAVWACTHRHRLNFVKIGRSVRYRIEDLDNFIKSNIVEVQAA